MVMVPPDWRMNPAELLRPQPTLMPLALVVNSGSVARAMTSWVMPQPLSETDSKTWG